MSAPEPTASRFNEFVVNGIFAGLSFSQITAWHEAVDAYFVYALGPAEEGDPARATLRALVVTAGTLAVGWLIHRCCRCVPS
jgi:hypothetical protein